MISEDSITVTNLDEISVEQCTSAICDATKGNFSTILVYSSWNMKQAKDTKDGHIFYAFFHFQYRLCPALRVAGHWLEPFPAVIA